MELKIKPGYLRN